MAVVNPLYVDMYLYSTFLKYQRYFSLKGNKLFPQQTIFNIDSETNEYLSLYTFLIPLLCSIYISLSLNKRGCRYKNNVTRSLNVVRQYHQ